MQLRLQFPALAVVTIFAMLSLPARAANDDWSFINGVYAIDTDDCADALKEKPFSKELVDAISDEVMTREGITSDDEDHCKFSASTKTEKGWTVKADCLDSGESSPRDLDVTSNADGTVSVANEDVFGPDPQVFTLCKK